MLHFTVTETGGREIAAAIPLLNRYANDFTPVWPRIEELFYSFELAAFDSEGASSAAGKWAALSERYSIWKARHFPGRPILERTGALRASLTRAGFGSVVRKDTMFLQITSEVDYAQWHQKGTRTMPRRRPVALRRDQVAAFGMAIHRYFDRDVMKSLIGRISAEQRRAVAGVR